MARCRRRQDGQYTITLHASEAIFLRSLLDGLFPAVESPEASETGDRIRAALRDVPSRTLYVAHAANPRWTCKYAERELRYAASVTTASPDKNPTETT